MAEALSIELRERVVRAYESGEGTLIQIGVRFGVGEATVKRWVRAKRQNGNLLPLPKGGGTPSTIEERDIALLISKLGDPTANELTAALNATRRRSERVHVSSMKRALHRHGYVVKKSADGRWRVSDRMLSNAAQRSSRK